MLAWIVYLNLVALLLSLAALVVERIALARRWATRSVWAAAFAAAFIAPLFIASVQFEIPNSVSESKPARIVPLREITSNNLSPRMWIDTIPNGPVKVRLAEPWLFRIWGAVSVSILIAVFLSGFYLAWGRRNWLSTTLCGSAVLISERTGPAVVGFIRPRIVLPRWVLQASDEDQALVMAHERSHIAARDPQLFLAALLLLVVAPWNLPLWWQLRRLRRAIEIDCDARVLAEGRNMRNYGALLLEVGRRHSGAAFSGVLAMSEHKSNLETRISIMIEHSSQKVWQRSLLALGGLSLALVAVAAEVRPPNAASSSPEHTEISLAPTVLDRYVGSYQLFPNTVMKVTREGNCLVTQLTGQGKVEIFAEREDEFFSKMVDAQITFETDAQGRVTGLVLHQGGADRPAARISDVVAAQIQQALSLRRQNNTPQPGSETALRRSIDEDTRGQPDYSQMSPLLAEAARQQMPKIQPFMSGLGALQSLTFRTVGQRGEDIYDVKFENGATEWGIALADDGKIETLWVHMAP